MLRGLLRGSRRRLRPVAVGLAGGAAAGAAWTAARAEGDSGAWTWPSAAAGSGAAPTLKIRSYNVLSDGLCDAKGFDCCPPEDVDNPTRLARVKAKLAAEMRDGAVICLQEVSRNWAGELVPLFEQHGYNHMTALSGSPFAGYMGQALAWPTARYTAEQVEAKRVSETVDWPRPKPKGKVQKPVRGSDPGPPFDPRVAALRRHNCTILARLREKDSGRSFCVATYHMPCLFGSDEKCQVMVLHASWLMQHAQKWAAGDPLVVAGDFNIKPGDPTYDMIVEGEIAPGHPHYPRAAPPDASAAEAAWTPGAAPMRSAYAERNGAEPEFTNLARRGFTGGDEFCETLDYLWLSPEWDVAGVVPLPARKSLPEQIMSFPSSDEPSDHILVGADLGLRSSRL